MKTMPRWLKYGVIFAIIGFVVSPFFGTIILIAALAATGGQSDPLYGQIGNIFFLKDNPGSFPGPTILTFVVTTLIFFLVGSLLGAIMSKSK